ncbi:MAG TPA: hypothetical protein VGX95_12530 [Xanthobacteraceae bacterium]|jgi:hypothetical protein|nr:hypothetical protein [Xanthobacteraceae bacterium]
MHSVVVRLVALASLLLTISAVHAQTPRATITFDNQSGRPALVKVIGPTRRTTQVPNLQKRTVTVLGGEYYILTRYGSKPDEYTYSRGDSFHVTQTASQYSVITITLHKVVGGHYGSKNIPAGEFDRE